MARPVHQPPPPLEFIGSSSCLGRSSNPASSSYGALAAPVALLEVPLGESTGNSTDGRPNKAELQSVHRPPQYPSEPSRDPEGRPLQRLTYALQETYRFIESRRHLPSPTPTPTHAGTAGAGNLSSGYTQSRTLTQPSTIVPRNENGVFYEHDNENHDLVVHVGMMLGERYEAVYELGSGAFGQVILCKDTTWSSTPHPVPATSGPSPPTHRRSLPGDSASVPQKGSLVAVKIMKSGPPYDDWATAEEANLERINSTTRSPGATASSGKYLVRYLGAFEEQQHKCLVFEHLKLNLFQLLEQRSFKGLPFSMIRTIGSHLFKALDSVHRCGLIHADVKPENIMLTDTVSVDMAGVARPMQIKTRLIDFGTATEIGGPLYSYLQSRYYRAPEMILGASYDASIDIWSAGAVLAEMFFGVPLLPGTNEFEQLRLMEERFQAVIPKRILQEGVETGKYYRKSSSGSSYQLLSRQEYYERLKMPIPEQPKCFRYETFSKLMNHRPFPSEDIHHLFFEFRSHHQAAQGISPAAAKLGPQRPELAAAFKASASSSLHTHPAVLASSLHRASSFGVSVLRSSTLSPPPIQDVTSSASTRSNTPTQNPHPPLPVQYYLSPCPSAYALHEAAVLAAHQQVSKADNTLSIPPRPVGAQTEHCDDRLSGCSEVDSNSPIDGVLPPATPLSLDDSTESREEEAKGVIQLIEKQRNLLADLIRQCMDLDPKRRPTPRSALEHPFFKDDQ